MHPVEFPFCIVVFMARERSLEVQLNGKSGHEEKKVCWILALKTSKII